LGSQKKVVIIMVMTLLLYGMFLRNDQWIILFSSISYAI